MQGRESEGSQARGGKPQGQEKRRAYNKAITSKTASLLGISSTRPGSSQPATVASPLPTVIDATTLLHVVSSVCYVCLV